MRGFVVLLAVLLSLAPARGGSPAGPSVRLRLDVPPSSIRSMHDVADRAVLDAFLAENPRIVVDPFVQLRMAGPRGEATFYMSMAGEQAPDALYVYERSLQKYINQDFLYPLNEYLAGEQFDDPLMERFFGRKDVHEAVSREGRVYAVPTIVAVHALLYRKDLFKSAGLDPQRPPATWDELRDMARRLTFPEAGQYGFLTPGSMGGGWRFSNFVWQAGGEVVRRQADGSWRLAMADPRLMEVYPAGAWRAVGAAASLEPAARARRFLQLVDDKQIEVRYGDAWHVVRDEIGTIKVYQMPDGTWLLDKLGPSRIYPAEWTAEGFRQWKRRHLDRETPPGIRALEFWREMRWGRYQRDGKSMRGCMRVESAGWSAEWQDFQQGKTAMMVISTQGNVGSVLEVLKLDPTQVGLAPLPAGPELDYPDPARPNDAEAAVRGRLSATMLEGEYWGINSLIAADKPRRDAAWEYIRFRVGLHRRGGKPPDQTAKRIVTRTYVEAGWAMSVNPVWLERFGYQAELRRLPKAWTHFYEDVFTRGNGQLEPYAPGYDQTATDLLAKLDDVLYDERGDPGATLRSIAAEANRIYFGTTPPEVTRRRRHWANAVLLLLAVGIVGAGSYRLLRSRRRRRSERLAAGEGPLAARPGGRFGLVLLAWGFMLPALLTVLIWSYLPLVRGAVLAFMDYRILGSSRFVWLDNFIEAFAQGGLFWQSLGQTLIYVAMTITLGFPAPILLAVLLSEIPRGSLLFRTIFYLPAVTSGLVVMFLWKMMYDDSEQGILNQGLLWLTGSDVGRVVTLAVMLAVWGVLALLAGGVAASLLSRRPVRRRWAPWLVLAAAAPFWFGFVLEVVGGLMTSAGLAGGGSLMGRYPLAGALASLHLRVPLSFAVEGSLRLAAAVATGAALVALLRGRGVRGRALEVLSAGAPLVLAGGSLVARMSGQLSSMPPYSWLQDPSGYWAMLWVVLPGVWAGVGPGCIIYLAALKSIPDNLYEAADVDGAGPLDKAWHITVQYLKPLIIINFVGVFVGTFHAMQNILVMTGGGPSSRTMTIGMDIFFNAFTHLKFGYATAEAWILGSLLIGFTVYQLRILKRLRFTRTG